MKPLLDQDGRAVLQAFLTRDTLVAFDYDGTLAPIVADRDRAGMRDETRALLGEVARRRPTIVLTGRARDDALRFLAGIDLLEVIGNHGLGADADPEGRFTRLVRAWREALSASLAGLDGVEIEDKRETLTVHFRRARDKAHARAVIEQRVAGLESVRIIGGKDVVNCVPAGARDKGGALRRVLEHHRLSRALFVGDDVTDEDVFRLAESSWLMTARIGPAAGSAAGFYLREQADVDELLRLLATGPDG